MHSKIKLKLTYVTIGIFFLLGGVEYAVILPTLWLYLQERFHAPSYMLGVILTAFPLSGMFAAPLLGSWSDRTGNTKAILLVANLFEVAGSLMYFLGNNFSVWFLVGSRLVAGVGTGVGAAIFADISRATSVEERTGVMSVFMAIRQLGLLLGPGCNLFLRELDFYIGTFPVDKYTSPGLFMALLWLLLEVMVMFLYWNLPSLKVELDMMKQQESTDCDLGSRDSLPSADNFSDHTPATPDHNTPATPDSNRPLLSAVTPSSSRIQQAESYMAGDSTGTLQHNSLPDVDVRRAGYGSIQQNGRSTAVYHQVLDRDTHPTTEENTAQGGKLTWAYIYHELVRDEVVAILAAVFMAFFNQTALETLVTPLTQSLLDWGELENSFLHYRLGKNSIMYSLAALEVIAVFALLRVVLSRRLSDRCLLLIGVAMETAALAFNLWFLPKAPPHDRGRNMWGLTLSVFLDLLGLPIIAVCGVSLYSKITSQHTQGFSQGVRRVFVSLATILGPLWPAGMMERMYAMFAVMVALNCLGVLLLALSYPRLKEQSRSTAEVPAITSSSLSQSRSPAVTSNTSSQEQEPLLSQPPSHA